MQRRRASGGVEQAIFRSSIDVAAQTRVLLQETLQMEGRAQGEGVGVPTASGMQAGAERMTQAGSAGDAYSDMLVPLLWGSGRKNAGRV